MMSKSLYLIATLLIFAGASLAGDGDGGYAGAFFQVPIGARPTSMGGAYLAVSNDGAAPLYNPAGLADLRRPIFASSYRMMKLDRQLTYATLMFPIRGNSALGVHWLFAGSGDVERRNYDGDLTGGTISQNNHAGSIIFAKRFENVFSAGIKLSYLHSTFAEMTAYSVGVDVGAMLYFDWLFGRERVGTLPVDDMQLGLTLKHLDASYLWNNENYVFKYVGANQPGSEQEDKIPTEIGIGLSGRLLQRKLLLATDLIKNSEQGAMLHAGAEYFIKPEFALRAGFSDGRLAAGTGYIFNIANQVLAIDYAFSTDKADEGSEHIFSFDLLF